MNIARNASWVVASAVALVCTAFAARPAAARPLSSSSAPARSPSDPPVTRDTSGTVYGLFVGINDYAGESRSLRYDVRSVQALVRAFTDRGLIQQGNAVVLTEAAATPDGVRRAFAALAPRVTPADTLVFFFNGHGTARTLQLRHGDLSRGELARLLDRVAGAQMLVIDSCGAGGFASIVGSGSPRRVGFFSARADETSYDATPYAMGGWLSQFMVEALRGGVPAAPDGTVRFDTLARYLAAQYDARVTAQHLVARAPSDLALFRAAAASAPSTDAPVAPPPPVDIAGRDRDSDGAAPPAQIPGPAFDPSVMERAQREAVAARMAAVQAQIAAAQERVRVQIAAAQQQAQAQIAAAQAQVAAAMARVAAMRENATAVQWTAPGM